MSELETPPSGRCRYEEFEVGETTIAMVQSLVDERAWIQSDVTVPVRQ
jgi:hypothetical protein